MKRWLLILMVLSITPAWGGWIAFHLFFLARGFSPLQIAEPNIWIARSELLLTGVMIVLSIIAWILWVKPRKER